MSRLLFFLLMFCIFFSACQDDDVNNDPCNFDFDQKAMFKNMAENIIIPNYQLLQEKVRLLDESAIAFTNDPNPQSIATLRDAFANAYIQWQVAAQHDFGPAEEVLLHNSLNNFPTNVEEINANLTNNNYDFNEPNPESYDRGFPALDYLLFGIATSEEDLLAMLSENETTNPYHLYIKAITSDILGRVNHTYEAWLNGYQTSFIENTGTADGTALSLIINSFNENYEAIKREKLGTPAGIGSSGFANPTKTEAFFSGLSVDLAVTAIKAAENYYLGRHGDANGLGLDDYVNEAKIGNLDVTIQSNFTEAINNVQNLGSPLSDFVDSNQDEVVAAYASANKQLISIKTDMPTALCVAITYQDNISDSD